MAGPPAYRPSGVLAAELGFDKRELLREAINGLSKKLWNVTTPFKAKEHPIAFYASH